MTADQFVHHVFFTLAPGASRENLVRGLQELSGLSLIREFQIGVPAGTSRDVVNNDYDVSWLVVFDTAADQDLYQDHPEHLHFVAVCKHLWTKVVVFDTVSGVQRP